MAHFIDMVANVFTIVSQNIYSYHNVTMFVYARELSIIYNEHKIIINKGKFEYYKDQFKTLSLIDLRNILILLIPFSVDSLSNVNTLSHVKLALKQINIAINTLCDNNGTNAMNLLTANQEIQNKYDALENKYNALKAIINDSK